MSLPSRTLPLVVATLATAVALAAAEFALRSFGVLPGELTAARFEIHEEVSLLRGMIADEEGVLKYDPALRPTISKLVADGGPVGSIGAEFGQGYERSLYELVSSFARADPGAAYDDAFSKTVDRLRASDPARLDAVDRAVLDYAATPLNEDGFRSIELADHRTDKTKVLLLGDSYTWGYSAKPLTASFADELTAAGYAVYNTGITAIGPAQYEHLGVKYIPIVRPDVVVVNFFMGNDIVWWERRLEAHQFPQYPADVGFINAAPRREYLTDLADAYAYTLQSYRIPDQDLSLLNRWCARSAVGTKLWDALAGAGWVERRAARFAAYDARNTGIDEPFPVSERHLARIRDVAEANGARLVVAVILDLAETVGHSWQPDDVFRELPYHVPELTVAEYWPAPDGHFNNEGHRQYARFLAALIDRAAAGGSDSQP